MSFPLWKGLLKWTLSKTDPSNDKDKGLKPMSKEDMAFLEGAMNSVNEHEREISNAILDVNRLSDYFSSEENSLQSVNVLDDSEKQLLLDSLRKLQDHFEEHPSNASSLIRQGLLDSFNLLMLSNDKEILSSTLSILSCAFSNNESLLEEASKTELVPNLMKLRSKISGTSLEPKLISALSSSVRHCDVAERTFSSLDGINYLKDCLSSDNLKTRERAVLLLDYFISLDRISKLILVNVNPYKIIKLLMPLDPSKNGIQFSELSCKLVNSLLQKHKNIFNQSELEEVTNIMKQQVNMLESTNEKDYENMLQYLKESL